MFTVNINVTNVLHKDTIMNLGSVFKELVAAAKADEGKVLLPLIANVATSVASNPTGINIVAQGTSLLEGAVAAQPNIGQDILKDLASVINAEAQALLAAPKA